jgi:hypothetical protein
MAKTQGLAKGTLLEAPGSQRHCQAPGFQGGRSYGSSLARRPRRSLWLASPRRLRHLWLHGLRICSLREWSWWNGCHFRRSRRFLPRPGTYSASRCQSVWQRGSGSSPVSPREWPDGRQCGEARPGLAPYRGLREELLMPSNEVRHISGKGLFTELPRETFQKVLDALAA